MARQKTVKKRLPFVPMPELTEPASTANNDQKKRKKAIADAIEGTYDLDRKIDALMEKHIKPLRQEKATLKSELKDDYGVPTKAFNARYGVYRLEKDAIKSEDDIMLDTVRELWEATPIGGGIDLEDLANRAAVKREEIKAEAAAGKSTEVDL